MFWALAPPHLPWWRAIAWNVSFTYFTYLLWHSLRWLICYQLSWLYLITLLYSPNSTAPQFLKKLTPFLLVCPSWLDEQHNVLYDNAFTVLLKWARSLVKILNNFYLFMAYNQQILQRNTWSYCSIWCNKCWYICQCEKMAAWNWSKLWRCPENFGWVKSHYI